MIDLFSFLEDNKLTCGRVWLGTRSIRDLFDRYFFREMNDKSYQQGCLFGETLTLTDDEHKELSQLSKAIHGNWERVVTQDPASMIPETYQEIVTSEAAKYPRSRYSDFIFGVLDGLVCG